MIEEDIADVFEEYFDDCSDGQLAPRDGDDDVRDSLRLEKDMFKETYDLDYFLENYLQENPRFREFVKDSILKYF